MFGFDAADRLASVSEEDGSVLANLRYDYGQRLDRQSVPGSVRSLGYDDAGRISSLSLSLQGQVPTADWTFDRNPASRVRLRVRSDDRFAWAASSNGSTAYGSNGLNQYTSVGSSSSDYDASGNLLRTGSVQGAYGYDVENRLISGPGGVRLSYDPLGRLATVTSSTGTLRRFLYEGERLAQEVDASGGVNARYVHGTDSDTPLVRYSGAGLGNRFGLVGDQQGSIVAATNPQTLATSIAAYDEYGNTRGSDVGPFRFTGQVWLPELRLYYYKARFYSAEIGRFLQVDPVGYADQQNLYAYVGNDPVGGSDSTGLGDDSCGNAATDPQRPYNPCSKQRDAQQESALAGAINRAIAGVERGYEAGAQAAQSGADSANAALDKSAAAADRALTVAMAAADQIVTAGAAVAGGGVTSALIVGKEAFVGQSTNAGGPGKATNGEVKTALDQAKSRSPYHGCCGEVHAVSNALNAGRDVAGGYMVSIRTKVKDGVATVVPPCESCKSVLRYFGIRW